ncbi:MAG: polysaccharide deacetylase family protein [Hyphomonadaceae bacterium]
MKRALKAVARATGVDRRGFAAARMCCERHWLATFGRARRRYVGRILCYHTIGQAEWGVNDVSTAQFRRHIETALNAGFRFVHASEIARGGSDAKTLAISFDDGLKSVYDTAAPILREYGLPWSFYPVTEWCDEAPAWLNGKVMNWRQVEELMAQGAELGSHSVTHPDFGAVDLARTADELGESRETMRKRLGVAPQSFAIPFGQSKNWSEAAQACARDAGYDIVYAQAEETRTPGTIARTFVTRFDGDRIFKALLAGKYDAWEEWV